MFAIFLIILILLILLGGISLLFPETPLQGRVVEIIDGDSIYVQTPEGKLEVRIRGIDAPEYRQENGKLARAALKHLVFQKTVTLTNRETDKFGRTATNVTCNGKDIAAILVAAGHAWNDDLRAPELEPSETSAKKARKGLWAALQPQAPWEFRKSNQTH